MNLFLDLPYLIRKWLLANSSMALQRALAPGLPRSCTSTFSASNDPSIYNVGTTQASFAVVYVRKFLLMVMVVFGLANTVVGKENISVTSPNKKITVALNCRQGSDFGGWFISVTYRNGAKSINAIPEIDLGLSRSDQSFSKELRLQNVGKPNVINERYEALHGKKSICENRANEIRVSLVNPTSARMDVVIRAYDDGVTFRYEFPGNTTTYKVEEELTAYTISNETTRWMEKWNTANEGLYTEMSDGKIQQQEWCYPALFNIKDSDCWFMLHEADLNSSYCGSKLSNKKEINKYQLTFPDPKDGRGQGESQPAITLPWKSPWRVVMIGSLSDIVSSTLTDDGSPPSVIKNASWVKPGKVSWNYWSSNHGTKDFKVVTAFADLAARMNWPYTLLDWEWDAMSNGGNVEDAAKYILSKNVKPLIWYNSGGDHTYVSSTPKDRMLTHENRIKEFEKLKKMGFAGVKIDFFESEKQQMIAYYLDILADAATYQMMVYFHGCIVPRGWSRTYPNLMTYEAVRGAEWYNNGPQFTKAAPAHNTMLPFTRNVVGPMDYTPVTFTNSQYPHITSYGHELALGVLFESGLQHLADRPEGYDRLPEPAKQFLRELPVAWDEIKLIDGYPGRDAFIARRKGKVWYVAGITASSVDTEKMLKLSFLKPGSKYQMTVIADGNDNQKLATQNSILSKTNAINVKMLAYGGFSAVLKPADNLTPTDLKKP